jgi:hypothetical protein
VTTTPSIFINAVRCKGEVQRRLRSVTDVSLEGVKDSSVGREEVGEEMVKCVRWVIEGISVDMDVVGMLQRAVI